MKEIFIIGAGGHAKEVYFLIKQIGGYDVKAFVDLEEKDDVVIGKDAVKVVAEQWLETLDYKPSLVIGIGNPLLVEKIAGRFGDKYDFPNLIHPSVTGNFDDIKMGRGNVITFNCVLTTSITIGSFNLLNFCCTIGHDTVIGDYNVINPAVNVSGGVHIGNTNLIGVNATILQYRTIGNNTIVGASSLVTRDVADGLTVVGIPAKKF